MSEAAFLEEVESAIQLYEKAICHAATRTRNMIEQHGEIEALSRLMVSADLQQGFKVLRDRDQLDKTFESVVVRFQHLFGSDAVQAARWRLAHPHELF
jgi:hypothetical protein